MIVLRNLAVAVAIDCAICVCPFSDVIYFLSFGFDRNPISVSIAGIVDLQSTRNPACLTPLFFSGVFRSYSSCTKCASCRLCSWYAYCISENIMNDSDELGSYPWYVCS